MHIAAAIDFDHLRKYTVGDAILEREVLSIFCQQADIWLRMLEQSDTNDIWKDAVHSLKGSARGVGATRVAALCEQAEQLAGDDLAVERHTMFQKIRAAVADAINCADEHMGTLG